MAIMMDEILFLDISNYLAVGTSYDKWIKAFQVPQTKGIWPYEWFQTMDQLEQDHLPPKEAFYSTLRQRGIRRGVSVRQRCLVTEWIPQHVRYVGMVKQS